MQSSTQIHVLLAGVEAALLICQTVTAKNPKARKPAVCAASAASERAPNAYWYYHALATSHPSLFNAYTTLFPCYVRKVIRT